MANRTRLFFEAVRNTSKFTALMESSGDPGAATLAANSMFQVENGDASILINELINRRPIVESYSPPAYMLQFNADIPAIRTANGGEFICRTGNPSIASETYACCESILRKLACLESEEGEDLNAKYERLMREGMPRNKAMELAYSEFKMPSDDDEPASRILDLIRSGGNLYEKGDDIEDDIYKIANLLAMDRASEPTDTELERIRNSIIENRGSLNTAEKIRSHVKKKLLSKERTPQQKGVSNIQSHIAEKEPVGNLNAPMGEVSDPKGYEFGRALEALRYQKTHNNPNSNRELIGDAASDIDGEAMREKVAAAVQAHSAAQVNNMSAVADSRRKGAGYVRRLAAQTGVKQLPGQIRNVLANTSAGFAQNATINQYAIKKDGKHLLRTEKVHKGEPLIIEGEKRLAPYIAAGYEIEKIPGGRIGKSIYMFDNAYDETAKAKWAGYATTYIAYFASAMYDLLNNPDVRLNSWVRRTDILRELLTKYMERDMFSYANKINITIKGQVFTTGDAASVINTLVDVCNRAKTASPEEVKELWREALASSQGTSEAE